MSGLRRKLQGSNLPPMMPPPGKGLSSTSRSQTRAKHDYTPVTWDHYFDKMTDIKVRTDTFRVYESGTTGPVCFCLHGGGFSALSWALVSKLLTSLAACRCVAMDFRGHGDTHTTNDENLSSDMMASDVEDVIHELYGNSSPPVILIGHSMGGAIAVHTAARNKIPSLAGLIVIDVVEGTALEALSSMQTFLLSRPKTFTSLERAIEFCVRTGQVRNLESARVSMVGQIKRLDTNQTATEEIENQLHHPQQLQPVTSKQSYVIEESDEEAASSTFTAASTNTATAAATATAVLAEQPSAKSDEASPSPLYGWRIDLSRTEKFWKGWFEGLSKLFLSCPVAKMLILAGVDRLDKELTVGQMQGKFQIQVLPQCGHAVHEDNPDKIAEVLAAFLVRNQLVASGDNLPRGAMIF